MKEANLLFVKERRFHYRCSRHGTSYLGLIDVWREKILPVTVLEAFVVFS